jgi:hypothetical protein
VKGSYYRTNSMGEVTTHQLDDALDIDDTFVDG